MKIAYLHQNIFAIGGTVRTVLTQAESLSARHDVEIVSVFQSRERPVLPVSPTVRITGLIDLRVPAPEEPGEGGRRRHEGDPRAGRAATHYPREEGRFGDYSELTDVRIGEYLQRTDADVVVATRAGLNILLARLAPDHLVTVGQEHLTYGMYKPELIEVMAREYRRLHAVVTVTEADAENYRAHMDLPGTRLLAIPNAIPEPGILAQRPDAKTIIGAGRLAPMKRHDILIDAFSRVRAEFPDWQLRIYGRGDWRDRLRRQILDRGLCDSAFLMGAHPRLEEAWALGSFAAQTSRDEPFGLTIVEAMRAGLPVVSTDCPHGPAEIIRHGEDGLLVANGDAEAVADGLRTLMSDPERRARMAAAALRNSARYDPAAVAGRHEELLCELTGQEPEATGAPLRPAPPEPPACTATVLPSGETRLEFCKCPDAVLLRHADHDDVRVVPDGEDSVTLRPSALPATGPWQVLRVDGRTEAPLDNVRVDMRRHDGLPDSGSGVELVLPDRDREGALWVLYRSTSRYAEVERVDAGEDAIAVRARAFGIETPDPDGTLLVRARGVGEVSRSLRCPVDGEGAIDVRIPLTELTAPTGEAEQPWDLRLRTGSGTEYSLGRALAGVTEHKTVVRYPERVLRRGRTLLTIQPYYTKYTNHLALTVARQELPRDPIGDTVRLGLAMLPGPVRARVTRRLPRRMRRRLRRGEGMA